MSPETPTAIVEAATTAREQVIVAPLAAIVYTLAAACLEGPALFIVGEVVSFRSKFAQNNSQSIVTGIDLPESVLTGLPDTFGGKE